MENQKVIFWRNLLLRTFIIGILFAVVLFVATATFWDIWSERLASMFKVGEEELGKMVVNSFLNLRIILVFLMLAPAIALHWMTKKD